MRKITQHRWLLAACLLMMLAVQTLASPVNSPQQSPRHGNQAEKQLAGKKRPAPDENDSVAARQSKRMLTDKPTGTLLDYLPPPVRQQIYEYIPGDELISLYTSVASATDPFVVNLRSQLLIWSRDKLRSYIIQTLTPPHRNLDAQVQNLNALLHLNDYDGQRRVFVLDDEIPEMALVGLSQAYKKWIDQPLTYFKLFLKFGFSWRTGVKMSLLSVVEPSPFEVAIPGASEATKEECLRHELAYTPGIRMEYSPHTVSFMADPYTWIFRGYPDFPKRRYETLGPVVVGSDGRKTLQADSSILDALPKTKFDKPLTPLAERKWALPSPASLEKSFSRKIKAYDIVGQLAWGVALKDFRTAPEKKVSFYTGLHLSAEWLAKDYRLLRSAMQRMRLVRNEDDSEGIAWLMEEAKANHQEGAFNEL